MSGRAGRRIYLLHPTRPRYVKTYHKPPKLHYLVPDSGAVTFATTSTAPVRAPVIAAQLPIEVQTTFLGHADVVLGTTLLPASIDLRVAAGVVVTPTTPAFVSGLPVVPDYWAQTDSSMTATGVLMIPDPDPIVTPPVGGSNPNPGGVAPTYTWHVSDVGLGPLTSWAPHGGVGPVWTSAGAFAPVVRQTVLYGAEDRYHTYTKGVHFDGDDVQHMWMDWGSNLSQPFTVIICAIIHYYPTSTYGHYLLDAGKAVSTSLADGNDHVINDGLTYRSLMLYQRSTAVLATHTGADAVADGKHVITRADFAPRPKMFFGIFNGSSSYIGAWDNHNHYIKKGTIDVKTHRYFVTGRRQNNVSDNLASHMTMFEMRMFNQAIGTATLNEVYKQLAATWKFNTYHVN